MHYTYVNGEEIGKLVEINTNLTIKELKEESIKDFSQSNILEKVLAYYFEIKEVEELKYSYGERSYIEFDEQGEVTLRLNPKTKIKDVLENPLEIIVDRESGNINDCSPAKAGLFFERIQYEKSSIEVNRSKIKSLLPAKSKGIIEVRLNIDGEKTLKELREDSEKRFSEPYLMEMVCAKHLGIKSIDNALNDRSYIEIDKEGEVTLSVNKDETINYVLEYKKYIEIKPENVEKTDKWKTSYFEDWISIKKTELKLVSERKERELRKVNQIINGEVKLEKTEQEQKK